MASNTVPQNPTSHNVASLLGKLQDADSDIRYMTLNDLNQMLINGHQTFLQHDYTTCAKVVEGLLHTLNDSHGEVQNMAIKVLGPFVNKAPETILCPTIEKVSNIKTDNTIDNSIPAIAVRAIVVALPHPVQGMPRSAKVNEAYNAVSKALIPRLVGRVVIPLPKPGPHPPKGMLQDDLETGNDSNSLDLLHAVALNFGPMLQPVEVEALEQVTMSILESDRCGTVLKKKAVAALSALAPYFDDRLLANHVSYTIEQLRQPHLTSQQRRLFITVYGSLARSIPQKFGPYLKTLAPFVLSPLSPEELEQQRDAEAEADGERDVQMEEVREAALVAIAAFLESCSADMRSYTKDVAEAATRFLKYEPNVLDDEDEDMEEEEEEADDFDADEDFEEETGFEDEDDVSWKVRRDSAKTLHALIGMLDAKDPAIYGQIAPALINRFKEREESVRTEVIATLAFLITKTGTSSGVPTAESTAPSRKRRRGFSDSLGTDLHAQQALMNGHESPSTPPPTDATRGLAKINPEIVKGASKLFKSSTPATKQALISLLKDMVLAQRGGLTESADLVIAPVVEVLNTAVSSGSNLSINAVRIEALALLRAIAETHSTKVIQPHLDSIIPAIITTAKDRFAKVSGEAFSTIEVYIKALTPPRSTSGNNREVLTKLFRVIIERISAPETDTEVRQKAVQALGLLIGRTSGPATALLAASDRFAGQQLILERMKNELTRLACVRAIDIIAVLAQSPKDFQSGWVGQVALELGAQLNKSSRSLRGASLSALRMLASNQASRESIADEGDTIITELVQLFIPLLKSSDLHMIGPALIVLASFAKDSPRAVATDAVIDGICSIVRSPLSGSALDALVTCVESIGHSGVGMQLMKELLNIAPAGDTDVTGQVIGTLLVSGGNSVGVQLDSFVNELQTQKDDAKRCLALSVLGEAGLRQGLQFALKPESFTPYFADASEKVKLAAAVALGRAGAGNVKNYLPKILDGMAQGRQYLLLHSVKELLQHSTAEDDIRPYTKNLWENIINSGQAEDNKVVAAECVGRLAIIDPAAYLPQLHTFLQNPNPAVRGMVIAALRYVFSDTDSGYDAHLQTTIIPLLSTMLRDRDLDNQRLSLATFNSALHNKPDLVLPHLGDLLPFAIQASIVRPELIREVSMGPFKHKIDDGLEMRKSAYETLYALLDSPASRDRLDIVAFYDRIVAGVVDEHEIKILCCLVLSKLITIAPHESAHRLDALATQFRTVLSFKPKDNAVKQELEKIAEQQKAVVKVSMAFNRAFGDTSTTVGQPTGAADSRAWKDYYDYVRKDYPTFLKLAEDESRNSGV